MTLEPSTERRQLLDRLQEQLTAFPRPPGVPALRAEQLLADLRTGPAGPDPAAPDRSRAAVTATDPHDPVREAALNAALLSLVEAFDAAAYEPGATRPPGAGPA
jgi:hypothetical protein